MVVCSVPGFLARRRSLLLIDTACAKTVFEPRNAVEQFLATTRSMNSGSVSTGGGLTCSTAWDHQLSEFFSLCQAKEEHFKKVLVEIQGEGQRCWVTCKSLLDSDHRKRSIRS